MNAQLDQIADRVRAQAELEAHRDEELFKEMVDFLPEAVFRTDANLGFTYVNSVAIEILGASPSDLDKAPSLLDFIDQADHARVMHLVGELGLGMRPFPEVVRARRSDGTALFIEAVAAPIFDADGGVGGLWGAGRDVTLRVRTEELAAIMNGIRRSLASTSDLQEALEQVLDAALLLDGVEAGCVYVADPVSGDVRLVAPRGLSAEFIDAVAMGGSDPKHGGRLDELSNGKVIHISHEDVISGRDSVTKLEAREGLRAVAMVPIMHGGRPVAMLAVATRTLDELPASTIAALEEFSAQLQGPIARI